MADDNAGHRGHVEILLAQLHWGAGEHMSYLFSHPMYLILVFILVSFLLPAVSSIFVQGPRKFRNRAKLVSEYARQKGYRLANPAAAEAASSSSWREMLTNPGLKSFSKGSEGITDIEQFGRGMDDPFAIICSLRSKEVTVFDFKVPSQRAANSGGSIQYKVAKVKIPGLPRFSLGRNSLVHTVETAVDKFTGQPKSSIDVDPSKDSEFAKHYWLKGADSSEVMAFLSPEKLRFLGSTKLEGTIATNANYLVYSEFGALKSAGDFDSFIATVENIVGHLL
jgi:hypothetical protein